MTPDTLVVRRSPFNTPVESALRALCVLYEAFPTGYDLQRLIFCDYLIVHSGDAPGGPPSLHPATPFRSNEFLVRRQLVSKGLRLLMTRGLVAVTATPSGFTYSASESAASFLSSLRMPYTERLKWHAQWVVEAFGQSSDAELSDFFNRNLDRWGSEFEAIVGWDEEVPE